MGGVGRASEVQRAFSRRFDDGWEDLRGMKDNPGQVMVSDNLPYYIVFGDMMNGSSLKGNNVMYSIIFLSCNITIQYNSAL